MRKDIERHLNETIGVFSLTSDPTQPVMWAHYGGDHRGIVVGFDRAHPIFTTAGKLHPVEYDTQRVAVSTKKGTIRVAGHRFYLPENVRVETLVLKDLPWAYESETRFIVPLAHADQVKRDERGNDPIYLKRFPPEAIKFLVLGARMDESHAKVLESNVKRDPNWAHLRIRRARLCDKKFTLILDDV